MTSVSFGSATEKETETGGVSSVKATSCIVLETETSDSFSWEICLDLGNEVSELSLPSH